MAVHTGYAPVAPVRQTGMLLLHQWTSVRSVVALLGNAPRSSGYRPGALLLSYRARKERRLVAARELHPALKLFRLALSYVSYATMERMLAGGTGLEPAHPLKDRLFSRQLPIDL